MSSSQRGLEDEDAGATTDEETCSGSEARAVAHGEHVDDDLGDDASGNRETRYATPDLVDQHGNEILEYKILLRTETRFYRYTISEYTSRRTQR